jgi:hypothetical protein
VSAKNSVSIDELEMLFNQQLNEYREIQDLKGKLVKAQARHQRLCAEIQNKLAVDASPSVTITAITEKGLQALPKLIKLLEPLG